MITVGTFLPSRIIKSTYLFTSCLGCIVLGCSLVSEVTALILHFILPGGAACLAGAAVHCSVFTCIYDHSPLSSLSSLSSQAGCRSHHYPDYFVMQ